MADRIVINVRPYQGEYEFDIEGEPLTTLEWRWVKRISDYLPMTIEDGIRGGDPSLFVAFAVVALSRAGKIDPRGALQCADALADAPFDGTAIQYIGEEAEDEGEAEPAETPETGLSESNTGASGRPTSAPSESDPSPTGLPGSDKSADSARLTSVG